jgi:hypothetical protein
VLHLPRVRNTVQQGQAAGTFQSHLCIPRLGPQTLTDTTNLYKLRIDQSAFFIQQHTTQNNEGYIMHNSPRHLTTRFCIDYYILGKTDITDAALLAYVALAACCLLLECCLNFFQYFHPNLLA